ncbi:bifunctional acetate--CoA ligase family protein/GNAT family N-acetyltransferase [Roseomonas sp. CECT 9278]|uniref:bifunctional acetate--CoA ligase family protein/GNAT family N-acetyltransferase n=1 Tax=Roseomonas sp. CECT 9278 TaxID=2845823 RepID=UPI001E376AAF|nr:GNAT family N-acetyltransferase [Roseomonas sp. CECT 9278]CAH0207377.1 Peptidyl-lysine N-acetyltransferase PatZ [Roseomonas sp. CECT 9278]
MLHRTMPDAFTWPARGGGFRDRALLRPDSVVLLADEASHEAPVLARNLAAGAFRGRLMAVGPAREGFETAPSIEALPVVPDLAVLCLAPDALGPAMAALAARGCLAAVVPGPAPDLAALSARTGVQALGQGSFGIAVPAIGLNATLSHIAPAKGRLALVTQSSAIARAVLDWAAAESVGFSHVVGIGGNQGFGFSGVLDWLARDPATGAILLDIRRIRNRRMFVSAARAAARTRPVVAIRAGGRLVDASGLADEVMEAALRRAGVLRVAGLEDFLAAAETLARVRPSPRATGPGDRIAVVTNGVGLGLLAADAVVAGGGRLAEPGDAGMAAVALGLAEGWSGRNPLALGPLGGARLGEASAMLAALPEVDAVVALHAPAPAEDAAVVREALAAAVKASRGAPILVGWAGQASAGPQRAALAEAGVAVFATPEAAVRGALHLAQDRRNRAAAAELPARDVLDLAPDRATVARILARVRAAGRRDLTEEEALAVLAAYGVPTVPGRAVGGAAEAGDAAAMLGFPVVLKVLSPDLPRKTEVGGVVMGLASAAAVRDAAAAMAERVARARPAARVTGFLVQRQAGRGQELRLRLGDDAMFGPWISFGRGGTAADIDPDEGFDLPPLNLALARGLIRRTRTARLLEGWRDHPPAQIPAIADVLVRLSQVAVDFPEIESCGINPLLADPEGVLALDASLGLRPEGQVALLAIPPYPAELARPFRGRDGREVLLRPIRPEDATAHAEAFRRLSAEDVRYRFFSALGELSTAQIARMTQIDYDREMAFVAVEHAVDGPDRTVGVSRLIRDPGGAEAEFAVIIDPAWKGQGLARALMERLFDWGREVGVREVAGQVLAENGPMLAFVRALGFRVKASAQEPEVMEARLSIAALPVRED